MTSNKPYLVRAIYEWILDNSLTPYITVATKYTGVCVPAKYIVNDSITLNLNPVAIHNLRIGNDAVEFKARFNGKIMDIFIPIGAISAIFAQENQQGLFFPLEEPPAPTKPAKGKLTLV